MQEMVIDVKIPSCRMQTRIKPHGRGAWSFEGTCRCGHLRNSLHLEESSIFYFLDQIIVRVVEEPRIQGQPFPPLPMRHIHRLIALLLSSAIAAPVFAASSTPFAAVREDPFVDVGISSPYYEAVEYLREKGVLRGYPDGTYQPEQRINRAEFVYLIANPFILDTQRMNDCLMSDELNDRPTVYFPDVSKDAWYAAAVCLSKTKDLVNGYPDGFFRPQRSINFAEAAKILSNVFVLNTNNEPEIAWYMPYVRRLVELQAIPLSINRYDRSITRGEMAEMLYRLKANITNKPSQSAGNIE